MANVTLEAVGQRGSYLVYGPSYIGMVLRSSIDGAWYAAPSNGRTSRVDHANPFKTHTEASRHLIRMVTRNG